MLKKKHYAQRQKERIQELEKDIEKILNGDAETILSYQIKFNLDKDLDKMIWFGDNKQLTK